MAFIFGTPVRGQNFINRNHELKRLQDEIEQRAQENCETPHIEISAPRRIGKSSILLEMGDRLKDEGYTPIYIYLIETATVDEFFIKLRDALLDSLSKISGSKERFLEWVRAIRVDLSKITPTYEFNGKFTVSAEDIVSLNKGTWKEKGIAFFNLIRKYSKKNIVLFLDEMGWIRKMKADDSEKMEFLNYLDSELSNPETPVCVLCGSQNFFEILRQIKPEIYQLWRRKFLRITIKCFDREATVYKLLIPNFEARDEIRELFSDEIIRGVSEYIYHISSGYPSMAQLLGKDIAFELKLLAESDSNVSVNKLKEVVDHVFEQNVWEDTQHLCKEIISPEALGVYFEEYKHLIYDLYMNESLEIDKLTTRLEGFMLDERLREIAQMQYIKLEGNKYRISYNFLKYYLWHPRKDDNTRKELESKWLGIFH